MVGLVPGGKGVANGAKGIIKAAAPLARQTTILGSAAGAASALRKNTPKKARNTTPSPALEGSPYHPDVVRDRVRPPYQTNPAHQPGANFNPEKGIEPLDASDVYDSAVRAGMGKWYGIGADGRIYQFFSDNAGHVHFSGYISRHSVPKIIREQLGL
jgi:hypothetical protein